MNDCSTSWRPSILRPAVCAFLWCLAAATPAYAAQPNVLLILADDVGSEVLTSYGGESYRTGRLDALAAEGVRYERAYAMPSCHPTRICLLTGQYPLRLGNPEWGSFPRTAERRTLPQLLRNAGYATAIAGKWQLCLLGDDPEHPHRVGFDEYCLFGWHEGPRYYEPYLRQNGQLRDDVSQRYGPDVYVEFLSDFITRHRNRPFFAFYSMALCHAVTNDLEAPVPVGPNGRYQSYGEMVAAMDDHVGKLLDAVAALDLRRETIVIFFSDNGTPPRNIDGVRNGRLVESPITSLRNGIEIPGGKGQLTDAGVRVPLIIRWPGHVEPGRISNDLVDVSDFLPTIAELAGAELPAGIALDGKSFAKRLVGQGESPREWVFAERKENSFVQDQRWKLYNDGRFFESEVDAAERRPLPIDQVGGAAAEAFRKLHDAMEQLQRAAGAATDQR